MRVAPSTYRFKKFCRRALAWGAPVLLAACGTAAVLTPDQLLQQQLALIRAGQTSVVPAAPGGPDPALRVNVDEVNGKAVCNPDCPEQLTVPAGHVVLKLQCRYVGDDQRSPYVLNLAADVKAGHIYQLAPAAVPQGCEVAATDVTASAQKPRSDSPGIRG